MATTPGQRFVRRHDAARTSVSNTTAADISYDTAVLSEGGYSYSAPEVTVDTAGKYLCIFDIGEVQLASTRAVGTLLPSVNTTDQTYYKARSRYLRNSGGNHGVSYGNCILNLAASDDVKIRNPGTVTGTDALGSYSTNVNQGGGFQMIYLGDENFTEVQRTADEATSLSLNNATRPWIDSTGTWTQLTFNSEVIDEGGIYPGTGGDITLAADTKYVIVYGATITGSSNQRFTGHMQLDIDGVNVQHSTGYERNNASDGPPMQGMYFHETGVSAETLQFYTTVEQEDVAVSNTVNVSNAYCQIYELPAGAEWIHVDNSTTDSLDTALAGTTTYYDTPLSATFRADGDSDLSLDAANDAVQNDSGASLSVLANAWHMWDRDAGTSGTRKHCWAYWDNGGTRLAYGISGGYNRGQQGNDDTHRLAYNSTATFDLANAADLSFVVRDPVNATNSDMGVYASTNRHYLGVQVLKLASLAAGGPTINTVTLTDSAVVSDPADPALRLRDREILDALESDDTLAIVRDRIRATLDELVAADAATAVKSSAPKARTLADSLAVADNHIELRQRLRSLLSAVEVLDASIQLRQRPRDMADSFAVSDSSEIIRLRTNIDQDAISLTDADIQSILRMSTITDSIASTDSSMELRDRNRALSDPIAAVDNAIASYVATGSVSFATLSDAITLVDFLFPLRLRDRSAIDSLTLNDSASITIQGTIARALMDSLSISDSALILRSRMRALAQDAALTDDVTGFIERRRGLGESFDPGDFVDTLRHRSRALLDDSPVVDNTIPTYVRGGIIVNAVQLLDQLDLSDFIVAAYVEGLEQIKVKHLVVDLNIDHHVDRFNINTHLRRET